MVRKTLLCFAFFMLTIFFTVRGEERNIFFIEASKYEELVKYQNLKYIIDNSALGLSIQRNNGEEFGFFQSLKDCKPSYVKDSDVLELSRISAHKNIVINGNVKIDGAEYVPSKILFIGQSFDDKVYVVHAGSMNELDERIGEVMKRNGGPIIICSWVRDSEKLLENYLLPFIFYDGKTKGIFYSKSTRNEGILDYKDLSNIIIFNNLNDLKITGGNIFNIYNKRISAFKNKRTFLIFYGYFSGLLLILNGILLKYRHNEIIKLLSSSAIFIPVVVLIQPFLSIDSVYAAIPIVISAAILAAKFLSRNIKYICPLFLIFIYGDALLGGYLLKNSLLSFEPALGARFYGIGNEYLGIILGLIFAFNSETGYKYEPYLWIINSMALLWDGCGSNFGGFLTCASMAAITSSFWLTAAAVFSGAVLIYFSHNHIKEFFIKILSENYVYVIQIVKSKLSTLGRLLKMSIWLKLTIVSIIVSSYENFKGRFKYDSNMRRFVICCILVSVFNDSGIVSTAIMLGLYINYIFYKTVLVMGE